MSWRVFGGGKDDPGPRRDQLSKRDRIRIGEAALLEVAQKAERAELVPEDLKQLALSGLATVLAHPKARHRELIRAAQVVQKWLAAEAEVKINKGIVLAVQIINESPASISSAIIEGHGGSNGHAFPRPALDGLEFRRDDSDRQEP